MNQNIKTSVGLAVIIILAVTAGVFVWMTQKNNPIETQPQVAKVNKDRKQEATIPTAQNDETVFWQTFSDEKIGISVKIPPNWETEEGITSSDKSIIGRFDAQRKGTEIEGNDTRAIIGGDYMVSIKAYDQNLEAAKSFDDYIEKFGGNYFLSDGTAAFKDVIEGPRETLDEQLSNNIWYKFRKNEKFYEVVIIYDGNGMSGGMGEKILSTLKFTDETADWQTYRNEEYGFEFKYSGDFSLSEDQPGYIVSVINRNDVDFGYGFFAVDIRSSSAKDVGEDMEFYGRLDDYKKTIFDGNQAFSGKAPFVVENRESGISKYAEYTEYLISRQNSTIMFKILFRNNNVGEKIFSTLKFSK